MEALYLKWRPVTFDDVIGQEHVTKTLVNGIKRDRIKHAYLFAGQRGTGKTTVARILAKALNCESSDKPCNQCDNCKQMNSGKFLNLTEIDAASHTGVDDVRQILQNINFSPTNSRYHVYIIDEVHRFSGSAFDALLKTIEEPPEHVVFVLATTEVDKVPATIRSRCVEFSFKPVPVMEIMERLKLICKKEKFKVDSQALYMIARNAQGSVRDAVSLLDQVVVDPDETITVDNIRHLVGSTDLQTVYDIIHALFTEDIQRGIRSINYAIDSGALPKTLCRQIIEMLRDMLLAKMGSYEFMQITGKNRDYFAQLAQTQSHEYMMNSVDSFLEALRNEDGLQPQMPLEMAFIKSVEYTYKR